MVMQPMIDSLTLVCVEQVRHFLSALLCWDQHVLGLDIFPTQAIGIVLSGCLRLSQRLCSLSRRVSTRDSIGPIVSCSCNEVGEFFPGQCNVCHGASIKTVKVR